MDARSEGKKRRKFTNLLSPTGFLVATRKEDGAGQQAGNKPLT
jgi:hypothetical protein